MMETDIAIKSYEGIKLHRKDGTEYWKLRLTCNHEPCPNEIEMGECLCFATLEAMVKARDTHGMHCSAECWIATHTEEEVAKEVGVARKALGELPPEDRLDYEVDDPKNVARVMEAYWDYVADMGYYDGSEFYEEYDIEECPI